MVDHIMTPELKRMMVSRYPFNPDAVTDYTPKLFLEKVNKVKGKKVTEDTSQFLFPEELRAVFSLRPINRADYERTAALQGKPEFTSSVRNDIRKSIVGWKRLYDASTAVGQELVEIPFEADDDGGAKKEIFDKYIHNLLFLDLNEFIYAISGLRAIDVSGL